MNKKDWVVYLIRCSDDSLYCGITNNLKNRLAAHNSGKGAKYTRFRGPVDLVDVSSGMTRSDALKLEYSIKKVPAGKKMDQLVKGEGAMTSSTAAALLAMKKKLEMLSKKVDVLMTTVEKLARTFHES